MSKSFLSATGILILGGILLLFNGVSSLVFRSFYFDLTQEGLYSLSQGTRNILQSVEDPITLRLYFSKTDAASLSMLKLYGSRVEDFLREYERIGRGKIVLEIYDPRPDSEEQGWADKYGLTPIPDQLGRNLYFGLAATSSLGREAAIPVFNVQRQEFIEYDITKLIYTVMTNKKPVIGLLSSIPVKGQPRSPYQQLSPESDDSDPWVFVSQLEEFYEVRHLEPSIKSIDDDVNLLMVIHPKDLPPDAEYAIDQFVLRGGSLFVAVDPYCQLDQPAMADPNNPAQALMAEKSSNLNKILSNWGVELVEKRVVGDAQLSTKVNTGQGGPPTDFVAWLSVPKANMSEQNVATSAIENMLFPWAGALELKERDGVKSEVLISSTEGAMLFKDDAYRFGGGDPISLLRNYEFGKAGLKQAIAVALHGKFKSNFPNGAPAGGSNTEAEGGQSKVNEKPHLAQAEKAATVIVISDVDFLGDRFSVAMQRIFGRKLVSLINDNLVFLLNIAENLTGSSDLIGIRSKGTYFRRFDKVQKIEEDARRRWQTEELRLQAEVNKVNEELNRLQGQGGNEESSRQALSREVLERIKMLREEKKKSQTELTNVRRELREEKESLGTTLFLINTFLVPVVLVIGTLIWTTRKVEKKLVKVAK